MTTRLILGNTGWQRIVVLQTLMCLQLYTFCINKVLLKDWIVEK